MVSSKRRPPDLDHCVQVLLRLRNLSGNQTPKLLGEIYVCGLGLLYHLKIDRTTIRALHKKNEENLSSPYPKQNAIPAISAVVHNQELFLALVSCLSSSPTEMETIDYNSSRIQIPPGSRKRTASVDSTNVPSDMNPSKSMKISHSPHVSKRIFSCNRPQFNVRLMAATILYVAFEHLDHWPAVFVQAYSEDCFGLRVWVDEPACRLFVENLELSHCMESTNDHESMIDSQKEADAAAVAEFYEATTGKGSCLVLDMDTDSPAKKRGSISSATSQNSSSAQPNTRPRSMSTDSVDNLNKSERYNEPLISLPLSTMSQSVGHVDDSDSGDEEEVAMATSIQIPERDDGGSSSSGEEDEEVVIRAKSLSGDDSSVARSSPFSKASELPPRLEPSYPIAQQRLNFTKVRQRYFGVNLEHAHRAIAASLNKRLEIKSKQNSGLLQTLPKFACVPDVRRLITANLEKWLQSPALAGLARSLFAQTVSLMKNTDPPLPADLDAIENILLMRLKANQLNAHVENLNSIAKRIPTSTVAHHVYKHLLREVLLTLDTTDAPVGDHLKMIHAVYGVFPGTLSSDGIAASLMNFLFDRPDALRHLTPAKFVSRMCDLVHAVAKHLGGSFNGPSLLSALADVQVPGHMTWTRGDEENRARLMFHCAILCIEDPVALYADCLSENATQSDSTREKIVNLQQNLASVRKVLLQWFCQKYSIFCSSTTTLTVESGNKESEIIGAGAPDYASILDGVNNDHFPDWVAVLRTILFLDLPEASRLQLFLYPDGISKDKDARWQEESTRIRLCYEFGAHLDDEMVWIVLKAAMRDNAPTPSSVALTVLEHAFHGCNKEKKSSLLLYDPSILWELYRLVEYNPGFSMQSSEGTVRDLSGDPNMKRVKGSGVEKMSLVQLNKASVPRLAYPGLWWRATGLALVMCGAAPERIGSIAWDEHPTLQALIKMVTSDRYRFPTVDCDDAGRDEMKKTEQDMRDEEANITETLFLPPKRPKSLPSEQDNSDKLLSGPRASRRQKEKRDRLLKKQKEKEAHDALKEANRRKRLLRVAQKSIMLWDPKKGPRKPPKESADLIFSVGELFDLPRIFQRTTEPDFLLMTIGNTTRGAIERAYDWLIPIISVLPEAIVRLPASASCFLLLRAYGTEGEERAQLQELSAPLLDHVRQSLSGAFGEADARRAFDLLLTDVASHNADRRRCARRVLHDALGKGLTEDIPEPFSQSNCGWMVNILHVRHAYVIVSDAIMHLARAASFERGRVLRFVILALDILTKYAESQQLMAGFRFPSVLVGLISSRPTVFASTMASFSDLRSLAIKVVNEEFRQYTAAPPVLGMDGEMTQTAKDACEIILCSNESSDEVQASTKVTLPLSLLESSCVLLSIWLEDSTDTEDSRAVASLVKMLMRTTESNVITDKCGEEFLSGLASAKLCANGKSAIPVESWVMLARSRSDFIAKRAALTAPTSFLPRLLLCSGLPRASLLSMVDRLGKLGEKADDLEKTYNQLLVPSASSEWDIGRLGRRKDVARKLLGRLSAYAQMHDLSSAKDDEEISITFLEWLSKFSQSYEKPRKLKSRKEKAVVSRFLSKLENCDMILDGVTQEPVNDGVRSKMELDGDMSDMTMFLDHSHSFTGQSAMSDSSQIPSFLESVFVNEQVQFLEHWLEAIFGQPLICRKTKRGYLMSNNTSIDGTEIAFLLLKSYSALERKTEGLGSSIVKWVPILSASSGSPELWSILLSDGQKPSFLWSNLVARCCQTWSHDHIVSCRDWVLSLPIDDSFDLTKVVRLLIQSISWGNIEVEAFVGAPLSKRDRTWGFAEDSVRNVIKIATASLKACPDEDVVARIRSRNNPPEALVLLLLLSRLGKKQVQLVTQALVEQLKTAEDSHRRILLASSLRLYAYFPDHTNLGAAVLRSALKAAVEMYSHDWLLWRSPMDDYFEDLIYAIAYNGTPSRMVQALADNSKKHPLLVLRKLEKIGALLEEDATVRAETPDTDKRGVVFGRSLDGPVPAKLSGGIIQVTIRHWGYNFTEIIWVSFLDVISVVPKEVLFGCGINMGLDSFLGLYLRLMFVQTHLRTSDRLSRLKGKLSELFVAFKSSNKDGWDSWMRQEIAGLNSLRSARNVLLSCDFISHQEAIENVGALQK